MADDNKRLDMNFEFLNTFSGYCKVLIIILNLLAFISASLAANNSSHGSTYNTIFLFISMLAFWISLFFIIVCLFKFNEKFDKISFNIFGFYYNCIIFIAYFLSSVTVAILGGFYTSASFFGLFCCGVYLIDAYLYFCEINSKAPFWQQERSTSSTQAQLPESLTVDSDNENKNIK